MSRPTSFAPCSCCAPKAPSGAAAELAPPPASIQERAAEEQLAFCIAHSCSSSFWLLTAANEDAALLREACGFSLTISAAACSARVLCSRPATSVDVECVVRSFDLRSQQQGVLKEFTKGILM